jgi:hypothetical protein
MREILAQVADAKKEGAPVLLTEGLPVSLRSTRTTSDTFVGLQNKNAECRKPFDIRGHGRSPWIKARVCIDSRFGEMEAWSKIPS